MSTDRTYEGMANYLRYRSEECQRLADRLVEEGGISTAEEWSAVELMRAASRYLFSAAAWLNRFDQKYATNNDEEE